MPGMREAKIANGLLWHLSPSEFIKFLVRASCESTVRIQGHICQEMRCSLAALAAAAVAASVHPDLDSIDYAGAQVR